MIKNVSLDSLVSKTFWGPSEKFGQANELVYVLLNGLRVAEFKQKLKGLFRLKRLGAIASFCIGLGLIVGGSSSALLATTCTLGMSSLGGSDPVRGPHERRLVVLDTNILLKDPQYLLTSPDHLVIPDAVMRELDGKKKGLTDLAQKAREVVRILNSFLGDNPDPKAFEEGVTLKDGRRIIFAKPPKKSKNLDVSINDDAIIATAVEWKGFAKEMKGFEKTEVMFMTNDLNPRIRAVREGVNARILTHASKFDIRPEEDSFPETMYLMLEEAELSDLVSLMKPLGPNDNPAERAKILLERLGGQGLSQNQFVVLVPKDMDPEGSAYFNMVKVGSFRQNSGEEGDSAPHGKASRMIFKFRQTPEGEPELHPLRINDIRRFGDMGLFARNLEQMLLMDHLMDPEIHMLTVSGPAGTGKTLIAVAAALRQGPNDVKSVVKMSAAQGQGSKRELYQRIFFSRPTTLAGDSLGYLPGTLLEKLRLYFAPIEDNLTSLAQLKQQAALEINNGVQSRDAEKSDKPESEFIQALLNTGKVKLEAIQYLRGRSIPNAFILIDEAQNMSFGDAKLFSTRPGVGTKLVFMGDTSQIDDPRLTSTSNGLSEAARRMAGFYRAAHITLRQGERSELATEAARRFELNE